MMATQDALQFLMTREITHMKAFTAAILAGAAGYILKGIRGNGLVEASPS